MSLVDEKTKYIIKIWPRSKRRKTGSKNLLERLSKLRDKISDSWPKDVSPVDEIRAQRTKAYGLRLHSMPGHELD